MSLLDRLFRRTEQVPLPQLDDLLRERGLPMDLPGLEAMRDEFEHLPAAERAEWADALVELHRRGQPLPPPFLDVQYDLLPEIVPTWKAERDGLFYRPILDGLSERLQVKGQVMPEPWLTMWGADADDLMDRALDHLRERSKDTPFRRLPSGVYQSAFGDGLDAARILLPELWSELFPGQNTFVAIPMEDQMYVAPQVLLPKLLDAIGTSLGGPGSRIQGVILQWVNSKLLPANLQDPHPIAQPQRELRLGDTLEAYRAQEQELDPAQGAIGPVGVLKTQQGRAISFTTWMEGPPVLLPEADLVGFVSSAGQPLGLYFRQTLPRISELKGCAMDIWGPRRLRYEGFPTAEQLERLECFATGEQMAAIFKQGAGNRPAQSAQPPIPQPPMVQGNSPLPPHLRGQSLGVQNED